MKLRDYKVKEYLSLEDRTAIEVYFDALKPSNEIKGVAASFDKLTFNEVSVLKLIATKENIDSLQIIIDIFYNFDGIKRFGVGELSVYEVVSFKKWVAKELAKIIDREKKLETVPDAKLIAAGIEQLNVFREFNTKKQLAEQFGFKPSDIGKWDYKEVYTIQLHNKILDDIRRNKK